jgi:YceI-like domain
MPFCWLSCALLLAFPFAALSGELWTGASDVKFRGYSTLHDFDGTIRAVPLKVNVRSGPNGRIVDATSDVKVKEMNTADAKRDANMIAMFKEAQFHLIKIEVAGVEEGALRPSSGNGLMPIKMAIAGTRGTVIGSVANVSESMGKVEFDLAFHVSLKAFKLDPPKVIGGLVKVRDMVDVTAHVVLKKSSE